MNNQIDYGAFPRVRKALNGCDFTTLDEKDRAFQSLVRCLIDKHVFRIDGKVVRDRLSCLEYFEDICSELEDEEIDLLLTEPNKFYDRFVFAPSKNAKSLFSELRKPSVKAKFSRASIEDVFNEYRNETGCSPYEKISEDDLYAFLAQVEALYA